MLCLSAVLCSFYNTCACRLALRFRMGKKEVLQAFVHKLGTTAATAAAAAAATTTTKTNPKTQITPLPCLSTPARLSLGLRRYRVGPLHEVLRQLREWHAPVLSRGHPQTQGDDEVR